MAACPLPHKHRSPRQTMQHAPAHSTSALCRLVARIPAATRRLLLVPGRSRWPKLLMCSGRAPPFVGRDGAMQSSRHRPCPAMQPRRRKLEAICSAESVQLRATIATLLDAATAITAALWFVLNCRPRYENALSRGWLLDARATITMLHCS